MKRSIPFRPTLLALVLATNFPVAHAAVPKDMLVIGKAADPQTLDPAVTIDNNDWTVTYPSYQRLVQYKTDGDKGSTDVEGDLASSWKASDDQKEWTFTLKDNAKFADGTPVTAEAVKLSFERLLKIGQGPAEAFPKDLKIDAPDEHTVKFTLSQPFAPFLYTLANDGASIINPAVLKEHAADDARGFLAQNTAGSGPFMLKSWQKGQQLVLVPNPHYPGNKPNFKRVSVKIIGESASRRLQLSRGDIDIADALPVDQLNALKQENKVNVAEYPSLRVTYLYLNNSKAPLNQADLRRAISWSTDYQGMVNGILSGNGKQMRGPIPEGMWGYDATAMQYNHDETKAKAEWDKVTSKPTSLTFLYSDNDPNWEPIALATQSSLNKLGINVKLEKLANATMRDRVGKGDYDIAIGNWSPDFADPYMFMNYWFESDKKGLPGNRSFYENSEVDKLLRNALATTDQTQRTRDYQQAQKIVIDDAAYVYLFQKNYQLAMNKEVKGFVFNPMLEQVFNINTMSNLAINSRTEDAAKIVQEKTGGAHAAVVTAVAKAAFNSAVDAVRAGGRVVAVGLPPESMSLDIPRLVLDGIEVVGSLVGTRQDLTEAFQFAAEGKVVPKVALRPLADINTIFTEMEEGKIRGRMVIDFRR
ncbi:zinc-binding dehydrogenase [Escherichia coli]|nr:zinc-binding dehydrogenase [Escherichia coli]EEZ6646153.1 zinc-binding dehydrogenase [Escherichia coli]EFN7222946.1 ABC transporter substrate-binding protein [Escherichia coli O21:H34]